MTRPVQEPTQGRIDQGQDFRSRQLFRRPSPTGASLRQTGWTVVFGDGDTPVVVGDYQAIWKVPRQIVGSPDTNLPWYIYQPSASVKSASTTVDVEIKIWRVRNIGGTSDTVTSLLDSSIFIDVGTQHSNESASPPVVKQYTDLVDYDPGPNWDSLMISVVASGDATGLSVDVPIGIEQPAGSGYHIP